jgi:potassium efflux system protein
MTLTPRPKLLSCCLLLLLPGLTDLRGQASAPPSPSKDNAPTAAMIRKEAEAVKADSSLDDATKAALEKRFGEAAALAESAEGFDQQAARIQETLAQGPAEIAAARKELDERAAGRIPAEALETADLPAKAEPGIIDARLTSERARVAELTRQQRDLETQLSEIENRPPANRERIAAVTRLLAEAEGELVSWNDRPAQSAKEKSESLSVQARVRSLQAERAMLEQEARSFDIRRDLITVRHDLVTSDLELARARVARLGSRSGEMVSARISEAQRLIEALGLPSVSDEPKVRALVAETRDLASKNQSLLARLASADLDLNQTTEDLARLRREAENIRTQVEIGGLEGSFAQIVLELRRSLPTQQSHRASTKARHEQLSNARLEAFRMARDSSALVSTGGEVGEILDLLRQKGVDEEAIGKLRPGLNAFVENRAELRRNYIEGNRRLSYLLGEIDLISSEILAESAKLRDFLGERLVWVASAPPIGKSAFTGMRTAFLDLAGPAALRDCGEAVLRIRFDQWLLAALLAMVLLLPRRRLHRLLAESAARTRRLSADGIGNTLVAMLASLWLALPVPVLLGFFGWIFLSDPVNEPVVYAFGKGLAAPAVLLLVLRFSSILCWHDGVAEAHFRWTRSVTDPLRRSLLALVFLYLPAHFVLAVWWFNGGDLAAFQGPGRLVFIGAMLVLSHILRSFFRGNEGIVAHLESPKGMIRRLRRIWTTTLVLLPVALAGLAALGHFLTAVALAYLMQKTGIVLLGGTICYALLTRWAVLRARRLALADAITQREARRASSEGAGSASPLDDGDAPPPREDFHPAPDEEGPVDWALVGEQTRQLIRAIVAVVVLAGCWFAWSEALPALKYLDSRTLFAGISLSDLIWLGIIGVITGIAFQNLPGLLELGFLRALELESGVRNAVITLCQYAVIAIGAALAFQTIGLDWSRFGWIAAALSVGLGFGLQEVVANFVSGLILLFERPIRVGDIVTVGGVDGVVTKIRIRATTITNWDKKEFIVPNKEFVTGTILNWTLSSPVTRLVFPVGIAYGSDIERAREILLGIATSQPEVLKDPAPAAIFEQFAESSLSFSLRCFVNSPEQRLEMTHRINSLIHERFAAAGIEVPYPHRIVHLREDDKNGTARES